MRPQYDREDMHPPFLDPQALRDASNSRMWKKTSPPWEGPAKGHRSAVPWLQSLAYWAPGRRFTQFGLTPSIQKYSSTWKAVFPSVHNSKNTLTHFIKTSVTTFVILFFPPKSNPPKSPSSPKAPVQLAKLA